MLLVECMCVASGTQTGADGPSNLPAQVEGWTPNPVHLLQGIAKRLIAAAESLAQRREVSHVYVHVAVDNVGARALYSACGYDVEKEESADAARKRQHGRRLLLVKSL